MYLFFITSILIYFVRFVKVIENGCDKYFYRNILMMNNEGPLRLFEGVEALSESVRLALRCFGKETLTKKINFTSATYSLGT